MADKLTKRDWWILGGGAAVVVGGIVYLATRPPAATPLPPSEFKAAPTFAPGSPGSQSNPIILAPGQLFGPQGAYATRDAGGMHQVGQFTKPVVQYGQTYYEFVATASTPLPRPPPAPTPAQIQAEQNAEAAQASQAARDAASARAAAQPTPAPAGVTFALVLDADKHVQLNPGQTLGLRFPPSSCNDEWQIANAGSEFVSTPSWNIIKANAIGNASVTFSCGSTQHTVNVQVVDPNLGHLQG